MREQDGLLLDDGDETLDGLGSGRYKRPRGKGKEKDEKRKKQGGQQSPADPQAADPSAT